MTEFEYCIAFLFLMIGFNIGYRESNKGLSLDDFKSLFIQIWNKLKGPKSS